MWLPAYPFFAQHSYNRFRHDEAERSGATSETGRFKAVFAVLADVGVDAEIYEEDALDAMSAQLATRAGARL